MTDVDAARPVGDRVWVLFQDGGYRMDGGVLVDEGLRLDATVVAVGRSAKTEAGAGDRVVVDPEFRGLPVDYAGLRMRSVPSGAILAVIRP